MVHPEEACWEKMGWGAAPSLGGWEKHGGGGKRRREEKAREEKGRDGKIEIAEMRKTI